MSIINALYVKLEDVIEKLCKVIGGISVAAFVLITFMQVLGRNFFQLPMIWANDLSVISFVWATFFGSAIAVRYRRHYILELIPDKYVKTNCFLDLVGDLSGFVFFYALIRYGYIYAEMGLVRLSTSLGIPEAYFFACIPFSACFMMFFNIGVFVKDVQRFQALCKGGGVANG